MRTLITPTSTANPPRDKTLEQFWPLLLFHVFPPPLCPKIKTQTCCSQSEEAHFSSDTTLGSRASGRVKRPGKFSSRCPATEEGGRKSFATSTGFLWKVNLIISYAHWENDLPVQHIISFSKMSLCTSFPWLINNNSLLLLWPHEREE